MAVRPPAVPQRAEQPPAAPSVPEPRYGTRRVSDVPIGAQPTVVPGAGGQQGWHVPETPRYLPPGQEPAGRGGVPVAAIVGVEGVLVAAVAVGAHLVWTVWGAVVVVAVWGLMLLAPLGARRVHGYREPRSDERVEQAWRNVQRRAGVGGYRVVVVESDGLNACVPFGRTVAVTSASARSLPPGRLEAVLAHELGHLLGWRSVPAFVHAQVTMPSRALLWTLRKVWSPIGPMWKRAVAWHRPIGFVLVLVLGVLATAVTAVVALPAGAARAAALGARLPAARGEARADAVAVRLGFGAELVAVVEERIEKAPDGLPLPLVRRAQGLRRRLG
ncbi:M48 family metalloprotease [Spirillospora sp. NPDC048832]